MSQAGDDLFDGVVTINTGIGRRAYAIAGALFVLGVVVAATGVYRVQAAFDEDAADFAQVRVGEEIEVVLDDGGDHSVWIEEVGAATSDATTTVPASDPGAADGQAPTPGGTGVRILGPDGGLVELTSVSGASYQVTREGQAISGTARWSFDAPAGTHTVAVQSDNPFVRGVTVAPTPDRTAAAVPFLAGAGLALVSVVAVLLIARRRSANAIIVVESGAAS